MPSLLPSETLLCLRADGAHLERLLPLLLLEVRVAFMFQGVYLGQPRHVGVSAPGSKMVQW